MSGVEILTPLVSVSLALLLLTFCEGGGVVTREDKSQLTQTFIRSPNPTKASGLIELAHSGGTQYLGLALRNKPEPLLLD